jgi:hypothetical protein
VEIWASYHLVKVDLGLAMLPLGLLLRWDLLVIAAA